MNNIIVIILFNIFFLSSCTPMVYPSYNRFPNPGMPAVIPSSGTGRLPNEPNFVQTYSKHEKTKANSKFGAILRSIEFEYDISDTLNIITRITSGFDEGSITGLLKIMLDDYELTYKTDHIESRSYVERISYESNTPRQQPKTVFNPGRTDIIVGPDGKHSTVTVPSTTQTVYDNINEKSTKTKEKSQHYNSAAFVIENEDVSLFFKSENIFFILEFDNCKIAVFPNRKQFEILKKMIKKYYMK